MSFHLNCVYLSSKAKQLPSLDRLQAVYIALFLFLTSRKNPHLYWIIKTLRTDNPKNTV